jgi:hypothetical protein
MTEEDSDELWDDLAVVASIFGLILFLGAIVVLGYTEVGL